MTFDHPLGSGLSSLVGILLELSALNGYLLICHLTNWKSAADEKMT